jgi:NAD(P)H dehydrogenase (quinone)
VGGAFASSANIAGGNETTILDILNALLIHGMVIQGCPNGDHYGPVAIGDVDDRARASCHAFGKLIAELAVRLHG